MRHYSVSIKTYISLDFGHLCEGIKWMTTGDIGVVQMLEFFKGGTAFVLAATDWDDDS